MNEPVRAGLTDRELMIHRWFSQLTFLQDRSRNPWPEWHDDGEQLGITSLWYRQPQKVFVPVGGAQTGFIPSAYGYWVGKM